MLEADQARTCGSPNPAEGRSSGLHASPGTEKTQQARAVAGWRKAHGTRDNRGKTESS